MAEIVLSPFIQATLDRLFKEVLGELRLFWGCDEDIENLGTTLRIILGVLADAEEKQQKENGVKAWLTELEEATRDADDILDLCRTEGLRRKMLETEGSLLANFFSAFNSILFGRIMTHKMKDIRERLDKIVQVGQNLGLNNSRRVTEVIIREETDSYVSESAIKGREEDRKEIVEKLLDMGKEEKVWIISVVGMGGLGKTTLAQLIFNNAKIKERFPLRIWVCVSDDYDTKKLIRKMLESADQSSIWNTNSLQSLRSSLQQMLSGKKFFLVLDDVWHKEGFDWERLISYLEAGEMGSKILVTTRSQKDASKVGTHELHYLNGLSEDDCWDLFCEGAFRRGVREENQKLISIGKEIVKKCGGLPLAVKAVGGLMRSKRGESEWRAVMESEIWNNILTEYNILPLLRWSYNNLPSHLKPCFAYHSIFPKDYEIEVEELIKLWMAEGLILPSQGSRTTEAIGREYFKNLLQRSFFQEAETEPDEYGKIVVRYKMHDLMHDLAMAVSKDALSISTEECRITVLDKYRGLFVDMSQRRRQEESITCITSSSAKKLKTLFIRKAFPVTLSLDFFTHLPFLRVLSLSGVNVTEDTLNSISRLQQLRYLSLYIPFRTTLPNSLSYLLNLQTLRLEHCWDLKDLPKDMRKMKSLRHLDIDDWWTLTRMPTKMGELTSLQTLPVFVVDKDNRCSIAEMKDLRQLKGGLEIRQLENVRDKSEAKEAKLSEKENIESLGLMFSWDYASSREYRRDEETLEALQPHSSLRELKVGNYYGSRLPHWMSTCSSLEVLILTDLANLEELNFTDQLNRLLTLRIRSCKNLESMSKGLRKLGALEELVIVDCPKLVSLFLDDDDQMQCRTRLRKLKVSRCDGLMSLRLDRFTALTTVIFEKCGNLKSFAGEMHHGLTALQSIMIIECPMVGSLLGGMEYLTSLRELYIYRCDELTGLPEGLKHATQLEILELRRLRNLSALPEWIGNLSSLRSLSIEICYKLASLPFDVFQQLTNLHSIRIAKCSYELQKRCEKDTGEDWHKLSHIENVEFDPRRIYTNDTTADYSYGFRVQPRAHRMVLESTNDFGD